MEEYAIYLRKSRADVESEIKGEGETLARHEKILLELAGKQNLKIGKIYKEIVSGDTIENRPEMKKLLIDVKSRKWKGILVIEIERLARGETMDQGIVAKAFQVSNTKIITPIKTYDPNNEFDEEYFEFGLFMSRREYKVINRRLQRGRMSSVNEGKYVGSIAPFGYDRVKITGDKGYTLRKNNEANTVKVIYDLYAYENLSLYEVTKRLNDMGLKPRKNNKWSVSTVKDILANPVYIGKIKWNARKEVKIYKNEKLVKIRPRNNDYILVKGLHESIIDDKTWDLVNNIRKVNSVPKKHNNQVQNPLAGLIICAKCGNKMKRKPYTNNNKEPILYCDNPNCDNISTKLYLVEEKVIEGLKKWLKGYRINYKEYMENINNNKVQSMEEGIKVLEIELKRENDKLLNVFNFLEDGTYTKEIFNTRKDEILYNIQRINKLKQEYKEKLKYERGSNNLFPKVEDLVDIYNLLKTSEEKNKLLKIILSKVTYLKTEKSIRKNSNPTNFIITLYPKIKNDI